MSGLLCVGASTFSESSDSMLWHPCIDHVEAVSRHETEWATSVTLFIRRCLFLSRLNSEENIPATVASQIT